MPAICDSLLSDTQGLVPVDLNQTGFWFTLDQQKVGRARALLWGNRVCPIRW